MKECRPNLRLCDEQEDGLQPHLSAPYGSAVMVEGGREMATRRRFESVRSVQSINPGGQTNE